MSAVAAQRSVDRRQKLDHSRRPAELHKLYHVAVGNAFPYHIYGAQQDDSNVGIASRSDSGVIGRQNWFEAGGGRCGFISA